MLLAACTGGTPAPADGVDVADGWTVEVLRDDLVQPTQVAASVTYPGLLYVAELAGGEDDGVGRVRLLDPSTDEEPTTVLDGLLTPTGVGVAFTDPPREDIIVQEQVEVRAWTLSNGVLVGGANEIVDPLPYNGRSQGTVTTSPVVPLLRVSTGVGSGPDPTPGSGVLYVSSPGLEAPVAVGFKNAYAHAFDADGDLWVTEIGDGRYDGEAPPDELNVIPSEVLEGAVDGTGEPFDGGWPRCTGDGDPTEEFGATVEECAALPAPVAVFPPRSTPTSVAVTQDGRVLVALWVENRVVEVDPDSGEVTDVLTGVARPQHLLAMPDGGVLLTVHGSGELWRLTPPA